MSTPARTASATRRSPLHFILIKLEKKGEKNKKKTPARGGGNIKKLLMPHVLCRTFVKLVFAAFFQYGQLGDSENSEFAVFVFRKE